MLKIVMNFAYLDARSLLESVLTPVATEPVEAIPCTLEEDWRALAKTLSNFKEEYAKTRIELVTKLGELSQAREEVNILKMMLDNVNSPDLKERLATMIGDYEDEQDLTGLTRECGELTGRSQAMKKVLQDTDPERYARFTCFVCMERLVDVFIDPCGHVMCERCWASTRDKAVCPGCRQRTHGARKIYTM
jgi:hypothetical protein